MITIAYDNYDISLLAAPEVVKITTTSDRNVKMTIFLCFNSLPPSAVYTCMRQWNGSAVVQVMACRLFGAKPLPEPMLTYFQLNPYEQTTVKFAFKYIFFIVENAFENVVCEMSDILSRGRWVNKLWLLLLSWLLCYKYYITYNWVLRNFAPSQANMFPCEIMRVWHLSAASTPCLWPARYIHKYSVYAVSRVQHIQLCLSPV